VGRVPGVATRIGLTRLTRLLAPPPSPAAFSTPIPPQWLGGESAAAQAAAAGPGRPDRVYE